MGECAYADVLIVSDSECFRLSGTETGCRAAAKVAGPLIHLAEIED